MGDGSFLLCFYGCLLSVCLFDSDFLLHLFGVVCFLQCMGMFGVFTWCLCNGSSFRLVRENERRQNEKTSPRGLGEFNLADQLFSVGP